VKRFIRFSIDRSEYDIYYCNPMKRFTSSATEITIREVAQHAGVSITTASYALNGMGRLAAETRERVLKTAEYLGYTPSIAARLLRGAKGNLIAVLSEGLAGPWYGEMLEGLQPAVNQGGFAVVAMTIQPDSLVLCRSLVMSGFLRGLVILNPEKNWASYLVPLLERVPTAVFDPEDQYAKAIKYVLDNRGGIARLMDHLWERGYRDYLWLDGDVDAAWDARERYEAFSGFLDGKALPPERRRRAVGGFKTEVAERAVAELLEQGRIPRAVVAANDESAIGALNAVRKRGLRVPQDIAVAGFDGLDISAWMNPALTTLKFDRRALGRRIARSLMSAIEDAAFEASTNSIPLELLVREST
jgi:LacI family transcriptional regulator